MQGYDTHRSLCVMFKATKDLILNGVLIFKVLSYFVDNSLLLMYIQ